MTPLKTVGPQHVANSKSPLVNQERLLTRRHVATLLSVHTETVKRMGRRGDLTEITVSRNIVRYKSKEVDALLEGRSKGQ